MRLLSLVVFVAICVSCNKSISKIAKPQETTFYTFDYKLQPSSSYKLISESEMSSSNKVNGEIDSSEFNQMPGLIDMLNSSSASTLRSQSSIITSVELENLSFKITIDSVYENKKAPEFEKIMKNFGPGFSEFTNTNLIGYVADGFTIDQKNLEKKNSSDPVDLKSITRPFFFAVKLWKEQKDFPTGRLKIGESFKWTKPQKERKEKLKKDSFAARKDSLLSTMPADKREKLKKKLDSLDQHYMERKEKIESRKVSHTKTYTLVKVEDNIAYFDVVELMSRTGGNINGGMHLESHGKLEYDLLDDYYRLSIMQSESLISMEENERSFDIEMRQFTRNKIVKIK